MKKIKIVAIILMLAIAAVCLTGCTEASRVSWNVSQQANSFNVTRRLAVINARSDEPIFELIGCFSIENTASNELAVICEVAPGEYKKHYIYLNQWTIYVVEDISGAYVDKYHYEVNFLPEMIGPMFKIVSTP